VTPAGHFLSASGSRTAEAPGSRTRAGAAGPARTPGSRRVVSVQRRRLRVVILLVRRNGRRLFGRLGPITPGGVVRIGAHGPLLPSIRRALRRTCALDRPPPGESNAQHTLQDERDRASGRHPGRQLVTEGAWPFCHAARRRRATARDPCPPQTEARRRKVPPGEACSACVQRNVTLASIYCGKQPGARRLSRRSGTSALFQPLPPVTSQRRCGTPFICARHG
jgi:hypothetical protein